MSFPLTTLAPQPAADWVTANPFLAQFCEGTESDTGKTKRGPGYWNDLGYYNPGDGGGGITNGAGNNVVTKSDGTNLIASSISDDGTNVDVDANFTANSYLQTSGMTVKLGASLGTGVTFADNFGNTYAIIDLFRVTLAPVLVPVTPAQITSNQNDYNALGAERAAFVRLSSDAARDITGIAPYNTPLMGQMVVLINVGAQPITLKNQSASSSAANRFLNSTGADIVLSANQGADLYYDTTTGNWRVFKKN